MNEFVYSNKPIYSLTPNTVNKHTKETYSYHNLVLLLLLVLTIIITICIVVLYYKPSNVHDAQTEIQAQTETIQTTIFHPTIIIPPDWPKPVFTFDPTSRRGEHTTRVVLETIYNKPFRKDSVFVNPETNMPLELDCYNAELRIAAEYNGVQHYEFPNPFHKNKEEFIKQLRRDDYKRKACDQLGIYLITVPYEKKVPYEYIKDWIEYWRPERVKNRLVIQELLESFERKLQS